MNRNRYRRNPDELRLAEYHIKAALAAIVRLQAEANADQAPWVNSSRAARGFLQLADKMVRAGRSQAIHSPAALRQIDWANFNRHAEAFARMNREEAKATASK